MRKADAPAALAAPVLLLDALQLLGHLVCLAAAVAPAAQLAHFVAVRPCPAAQGPSF